MSKESMKIVDQLITLINEHREFPAMARTIASISQQTSPDSEASITELTNTILDDFALTNKLLRMVNTVYYIKYHVAGQITTVSRAVYILGFHQVRDAALSLMLLEHLKSKTLALEIKESFIVSFMSGATARELTKKLHLKEVEEAFICAMFHDLGKLLVRFFLPSEANRIKLTIATESTTEEDAARTVLNSSYDAIGMNVARHWNLSDHIVQAMKKIPLHKIDKPVDINENLQYLSIFSNKLCDLIGRANIRPDSWDKVLKTFIANFEKFFVIPEEDVKTILNNAINELMVYMSNFKFNVDDSPFLKKLIYLVRGGEKPDITDFKVNVVADKLPLLKSGMQMLDGSGVDFDAGLPDTPDDILTRGILEIGSALLEDYSLNDILRMILEVMYRGLEFTRVVICIMKAKEQFMEGRLGFGPNIELIVKDFRFKVADSAIDVFNVSISKEASILINDTNDEKIKPRIPDWYTALLNAETFVVVPVVVKKRPIAVIYGDWLNAYGHTLNPKMLRYLKTLRNQAIQAFKQLMQS